MAAHICIELFLCIFNYSCVQLCVQLTYILNYCFIRCSCELTYILNYYFIRCLCELWPRSAGGKLDEIGCKTLFRMKCCERKTRFRMKKEAEQAAFKSPL